MKEEHEGPGLFQRAGEFPTSFDPEYPMSQIAIDYYKNGPSLLPKYLPFWMTIYAQRPRGHHEIECARQRLLRDHIRMPSGDPKGLPN
jgi:hypothetical protein